MKKYILISSIALISLSVACSNEQSNTEDTTTPLETNEVSSEPTDEFGTTDQTGAEAPVEMFNQEAAPQAAATGNKSGLKLNPPHGEPGHRCDVNVGEPLPTNDPNAPVTVQSPPPQNMQIQSSQPQNITATPAPAPTSIMNAPAPAATSTPGATPAGMNPPHGEPGHDCAIPVGSPLKK